MENKRLKGGITNTYEKWQAEPDACNKCISLDGKVFTNISDVPEKPHPNCKCKIEELSEDELCNCISQKLTADYLAQQAIEILENAERDYNEINSKAQTIKIDSNWAQGLINDYLSLREPLISIWRAASSFLVNYQQMKDADVINGDKYFHAKANCEASQAGIIGELIAKLISDIREIADSYKNVCIKKMYIEDSLKDIKEDENVDLDGRNLGRNNPWGDAYDLVKYLMPNGFPERYKKWTDKL